MTIFGNDKYGLVLWMEWYAGRPRGEGDCQHWIAKHAEQCR